MNRIGAVLAAAAVLTTAAARPYQRTDLVLDYQADAGYAVAVRLSCYPARGAHPNPVEACATLAEVDGRPDRITPADTMCTMQYDPLTAEITGTWKGRRIAWKQRYGNTCEMIRATGVLFTF